MNSQTVENALDSILIGIDCLNGIALSHNATILKENASKEIEIRITNTFKEICNEVQQNIKNYDLKISVLKKNLEEEEENHKKKLFKLVETYNDIKARFSTAKEKHLDITQTLNVSKASNASINN